MAKKTFLDFEQPVVEREAKLLGERSSLTCTNGRQAEVADLWLRTITGSTTANAAPLYLDGLHPFDWWLPVGPLGVTVGLYAAVHP